MNQYLIWGANLALGVLCAYLVAGIITDVGSAALVPEDSAALAPPTESRRVAKRADPQKILERNLFNASLLKPEAPTQPEPDPEEEAEDTRLPLKLLGTAASDDPQLAWAAVEDLDERKHVVVAAGSELKTATVERIERRRILLRNRGRLEQLTLDEEDEGSQVSSRRSSRPPRANRRSARRPTARSRAADPARGIRKLAENRFQVDRDELEDKLSNPAALFSEARILPKYEDGEMVGIQLNSIKEDSLFKEVGLQNGDTIIEFNGKTLTSPADSQRFLTELMEGDEFEVLVRGKDGGERKLNFE